MGFVTHNEGGTWVGDPGHAVPNCSDPAFRTQVEAAFAAALGAGLNCIRATPGLDELATLLATKTLDAIDIDCDDDVCRQSAASLPSGDPPLAAERGPGLNRIAYCTGAFTLTQQALNALTFHELIHSCGGYEIDAYALEAHCFSGSGATSVPTVFIYGPDPLPCAAGHLLVGRFVVWDHARSGRVFVKNQSGGDWLSAPAITAGADLNVQFGPDTFVMPPWAAGCV